MTTTQSRNRLGNVPIPAGLAVAAVGSGGSFAAATYFWKITLVTDWGESAPSNEATVAIVLNGSANLTWTQPPPGVLAVNVYRGTVTNTENKLVATVAAQSVTPPAAYTDTGTAGITQSPPAAPAAFANVTLDTVGRTSPADALVSGLPAWAQPQALQACNTWHNCAGVGDQATAALKRARALGFELQDV